MSPDYRRSGLMMKMLVFGQPYAVAMGFETAVMSVREGNPMGLGLAEAFGSTLNERSLVFDLSQPGGPTEAHHG
jgi:hypothetical protein